MRVSMSNSRPSNSNEQWESAESDVQWFLNAELLSELDEEYRKKNRKFRAFVNAAVRAPNHPLGFLKRRKGIKYDAGHVVPVKHLNRRGTVRERLVVEDRRLNRSKQAKAVSGIVKVGGIPVDCASIDHWRTAAPASYRPRLEQIWQDCQKRRNTSQGWFSTDEKVHEFEFMLSYPNVSWVRRATAGEF